MTKKEFDIQVALGTMDVASNAPYIFTERIGFKELVSMSILCGNKKYVLDLIDHVNINENGLSSSLIINDQKIFSKMRAKLIEEGILTDE